MLRKQQQILLNENVNEFSKNNITRDIEISFFNKVPQTKTLTK